MTSRQLAILNSLVTYAAENVPGGLTNEEQEVAKIVGTAVLIGNYSEERKQDFDSWVRCLRVELAAGDISIDEFHRDLRRYERIYGQ